MNVYNLTLLYDCRVSLFLPNRTREFLLHFFVNAHTSPLNLKPPSFTSSGLPRDPIPGVGDTTRPLVTSWSGLPHTTVSGSGRRPSQNPFGLRPSHRSGTRTCDRPRPVGPPFVPPIPFHLSVYCSSVGKTGTSLRPFLYHSPTGLEMVLIMFQTLDSEKRERVSGPSNRS